MNVLVIDPSKVFRTVWDRMVLRIGQEPVSVETGEQGLEVLRSRHIDLVCVSLSLPDMTGIDFCKELRAQKQHRNIPVILLTSTDDKAVRERAFKAGITEIHSKSDVDALLQRVKIFVNEMGRHISGRVLYIEDSSVVAHVMIGILDEMELEVDHFTSADEAFENFQSVNYDLIISDIMVEGQMSGVGLVTKIRSMDGEKSRVPILAVSGLDDSVRRAELFRLGINDFISKPPVKQEVIARVTNLITNKQLFDQVKMQQQHLYELAMRDHLTGLYNRNSLKEFANKYFSEAARHEYPLSLVLIDLDHFKSINDNHGHLAGDSVLEQVGEMLRNNCREGDFAARFGGEEFLLILPHCDLSSARTKAELIRKEIEQLEPEGIAITASLGITARPRGTAADLETLFKVADAAVYEAKHRGRNCIIAKKYKGGPDNDKAPAPATGS
ncbi:MAG: diguanylate cyclase [Gammaproteobacteria bacterium]|nr:diguanylate cyclase [Gammaproteobacteria bacterium]